LVAFASARHQSQLKAKLGILLAESIQGLRESCIRGAFLAPRSSLLYTDLLLHVLNLILLLFDFILPLTVFPESLVQNLVHHVDFGESLMNFRDELSSSLLSYNQLGVCFAFWLGFGLRVGLLGGGGESGSLTWFNEQLLLI